MVGDESADRGRRRRRREEEGRREPRSNAEERKRRRRGGRGGGRRDGRLALGTTNVVGETRGSEIDFGGQDERERRVVFDAGERDAPDASLVYAHRRGESASKATPTKSQTRKGKPRGGDGDGARGREKNRERGARRVGK